jgi:hypothetical protein
LNVPISPEQDRDRDSRLQAREMTTQASVRARAKREMRIILPPYVELIWIGKLGWIAIGRSHEDDDRLARF